MLRIGSELRCAPRGGEERDYGPVVLWISSFELLGSSVEFREKACFTLVVRRTCMQDHRTIGP